MPTFFAQMFFFTLNADTRSLWEKIQDTLIADKGIESLLRGLIVTLVISLIAMAIGTILGAVLAFGKMSKFKPLSLLCNLYITVVRGTPAVVQLMIIYFGVFSTAVFSDNSTVNKTIIASIGFGLNSAAYVAEIVRAGVQGVNKGQLEAGLSLGLNKRKTMWSVILPQAVKNILPTYTSEFITLIKETSIVGFIGLMDLTKVAESIRSRTYSAWIPLLTVAMIYLFLTTVLAWIFSRIERRLHASDGK